MKITVHDGKSVRLCWNFYYRDAIVVEPAGALALAALDQLSEEIKGKNV